MIIFERTKVTGWDTAIRGMRNPLESWNRSDTVYVPKQYCDEDEDYLNAIACGGQAPIIGKNDLGLMKRLANAGSDHAKFLRMINVTVDITAPLYWWKEFDTYKVGTVANSCSTMHCIHKKEFTLDDFSHEHLVNNAPVPTKVVSPLQTLQIQVCVLNEYRDLYLETKDKSYWWQMIQLLPSSYNQTRTVQMNYEVLSNIYKSRKNHKLDEWSVGFINWIKDLPYSELITKENKED